MASEKKPVKGILKSSTSFDKGGEHVDTKNEKREMKWDEMSIMATYHPEGKEYGHMKIDEPPTPYSKMLDGDISDDEKEELDAEALAARLEKGSPRGRSHSFQGESSEEDENETEEERAKRKQFELKRKLHYNEYHAVKLGKQLLEQGDDDEDEDETPNTEAKNEESQ